MYQIIFFTNILRALEEHGWTKNDLASRSGVSISFLSDLTTGKANPSLKVMEAIADALNKPLPQLLAATDLDAESFKMLQEGRGFTIPSGFTWVYAVLPDHQAYIVQKWDREARKKLKKS